jgi:SSS family solute:Na+ symporter/sodium/proline symporter
MSTLSSVVLTSSSAISVDLIKVTHPEIKDKNQMIIMRTLCLLFVALSFIFATMNISFIVNLMSFSWGIVAGSFIGPFLWGLYWKKTTKAGAWAGALSGLVTVSALIIITTVTKDFAQAKALAPEFGVSAMAVSVVIVPLVSLFTKKPDEKLLEKAFAKVEE